MRKRILRNNKGFTLIELIATITLMAIIAGIAVPSVYYSTSKRQKSAAEYDTQTMYRNAISCISDLEALYVTPESPLARGEIINDNGGEPENTNGLTNDGWYVEYSKKLARQLYKTIVGLDIDVLYYDAFAADKGMVNDITKREKGLKVPTIANWTAEQRAQNPNYMPALYTHAERSSMISAGNKNPYIVIQVIKVEGVDYVSNASDYENYLIISYHNEKNAFVSPHTLNYGAMEMFDNLSDLNAYETNKDNPIIYKYKIRKK